MVMDGVAQMIVPQPDSHFRLKNCRCGSDQVAYLEVCTNYGQLMWKVRCMDCGRETGEHAYRRASQLEWNT